MTKSVATCEWSGCQNSVTHVDVITFPDRPGETWHVCRAHDRQLKTQVVRSRPKPPPPPDVPPVVEVQCGGCREPLAEASDLPVEQRQPCPACGSMKRHHIVGVTATLDFHESIRARSKVAGKGGWMVDVRTGDDYTRDLDAWGKLERTEDRARDVYREVVELFDGTRIESAARLRDHHD